MLNKEIHQALEDICIKKGINANTKKQIGEYLDKLSIGAETKSELDMRIDNILRGLIHGA